MKKIDHALICGGVITAILFSWAYLENLDQTQIVVSRPNAPRPRTPPVTMPTPTPPPPLRYDSYLAVWNGVDETVRVIRQNETVVDMEAPLRNIISLISDHRYVRAPSGRPLWDTYLVSFISRAMTPEERLAPTPARPPVMIARCPSGVDIANAICNPVPGDAWRPSVRLRSAQEVQPLSLDRSKREVALPDPSSNDRVVRLKMPVAVFDAIARNASTSRYISFDFAISMPKRTADGTWVANLEGIRHLRIRDNGELVCFYPQERCNIPERYRAPLT